MVLTRAMDSRMENIVKSVLELRSENQERFDELRQTMRLVAQGQMEDFRQLLERERRREKGRSHRRHERPASSLSQGSRNVQHHSGETRSPPRHWEKCWKPPPWILEIQTRITVQR